MSSKNTLLHGTSLDWQRKQSFEMPIVQITNSQTNRILTLSPLDLRDFFTSQTMEFARSQPIDKAMFEKLARALRVELSEQLQQQIYETIVGTVLMVVHQWHSPRTLLALFKDLKRDALATIARTRGDAFAQYVIVMIESEAKANNLTTREVIKKHIDAVREVIRPGAPGEEARAIFIETVIEIARRQGDTLALPRRDETQRSTPLLEFSSDMRDLAVQYGNGILDRRNLPRGRFDGFSRLEREALIRQLEHARSTILRENSNTYP